MLVSRRHGGTDVDVVRVGIKSIFAPTGSKADVKCGPNPVAGRERCARAPGARPDQANRLILLACSPKLLCRCSEQPAAATSIRTRAPRIPLDITESII